jgi:hypothetical protein
LGGSFYRNLLPMSEAESPPESRSERRAESHPESMAGELKPVCMRCEQSVEEPATWRVWILGQPMIYVMCPHCGTALGITRLG